MTHFAGKLAAVTVASDINIGQAQRRLLGVVNFVRQQNGSGARAKHRAAARGMFPQRLIEAFLDQKFPLRGAFAAGQNDRVDAGEISRRTNENMIDTHARKRRGVGFKIALNGQDSDPH